MRVKICVHIYLQTSKNRRRHSRKTEPESEESDSDQDPLTSSRTESSNQLDSKIKHSMIFPRFVQCTQKTNENTSVCHPTGVIYHGNQSSTSSDLSPMSEQKSLPRRGRSRYHTTYNTNTTPRHKPTPTIAQPPPSSSSHHNHQLQHHHHHHQLLQSSSHSNTPTLLASSAVPATTRHPNAPPTASSSASNIITTPISGPSINNTYQLTPRMPSQFRPIPHRTITVPAIITNHHTTPSVNCKNDNNVSPPC